MKRLVFLLPLSLFAFDRNAALEEINKIEAIYKQRLTCMRSLEAHACIEKHPQDPKSDALAKTFSMAFPKSYYAAKLRRDLKILEKQKLCIGQALNQHEAQACLKAR